MFNIIMLLLLLRAVQIGFVDVVIFYVMVPVACNVYPS